VLALCALVLAALGPMRARADGTDEPPGKNERVVKIGPQAVVIENEDGDVRMYSDPSQQAPACKSRSSCWGKALNMLSLFGLMTYLDLTEGVESGGRVTQRIGPPD
jgi:hypothetical protein